MRRKREGNKFGEEQRGGMIIEVTGIQLNLNRSGKKGKGPLSKMREKVPSEAPTIHRRDTSKKSGLGERTA